ncbi:MAG TPA: N-acetylmuramoyl-L-alanine amidase [Thermoanaerobaculia bacterium]|jgi:N-acetylmuramoyl-L-alanine amidase
MALWLGAALAAPALAAGAGVRAELADGLTASLTEEQAIYLEASPKNGEGMRAFSQRLTGRAQGSLQLAGAAGASARTLEVGQRYRIPFAVLSPERQLKVATTLFPDDKPQADGWRHQVRGTGPLQRESLWHLAEWFTGSGENFRAIREYNELSGGDDDVPRGTAVVVPAELLLPAFRGSIPAAESSFRLDYGKDKDGEYAIYRLRTGEALYSSVVVRFTGRIHAADVNSLAIQIAQRSGIADVTEIPVGYRVKIPFDLLQPEFLPQGHPLRTEYEASLRASARYSNHVRALGLENITVILDAGHGGKDSGATQGEVWESLYVYDIVMRAKRLLEGRTAARVVATTRDGADFEIADSDVIPASRRHSVLTDPPYPIEDPTVGVHLRWYLANSVFRKAVQQAGDPEKVVFLSIHADSLHPSLRGAMAYIPAAAMRDDSFGKSGPVYALRKEFQESPRVSFPWEQRVKSEGLSRALAKQMVAAFGTAGLAVHPDKPVREKIIRDGREWVPAVLRYNTVPAKMLLEVCNLNNPEDRRLLQTRAWRQKVAEAIYRGLLGYYGKGIAVPEAQIAKTR